MTETLTANRRASARTNPVVADSLLEGILRATSDTSIIAIDVEGTISFVNRGAEEMLGYEARELIGRTPAEFHDLDELRLRLADLMAAVPDVGGAPRGTRSDWTYDRRDGNSITVSLAVTAILDPGGTVLGYVAIADDVTDDRWAHQLVGEALAKEAEANQRLVAVNLAKDDFIATMGHELRTPLASMRGYTELLRDGEGGQLSEEQEVLLSRIEGNAERLVTLVENLLTNARVEAESFSVPRRVVDLNDLVRAALSDCPSVKRPGLEVEVRFDPWAPAVVGNPDDLQRVVLNLLANAATYTPDGGRITISTNHTNTESYIVVADTGVGIPPAEQDQIFVPYFRSSISHERAVQGPGVGLSIVKSIVTAHRGTVSVTSDVGAGSVFLVRLPSAKRRAE